MWRDLQQKWRTQGVLTKQPVTDKELNEYYKVFDDFNSQYEGVSHSDLRECRALINTKVKLRRVSASRFQDNTVTESIDMSPLNWTNF